MCPSGVGCGRQGGGVCGNSALLLNLAGNQSLLYKLKFIKISTPTALITVFLNPRFPPPWALGSNLGSPWPSFPSQGHVCAAPSRSALSYGTSDLSITRQNKESLSHRIPLSPLVAHRLHRRPYLSSPEEERRLWSPYCNTFIYLICNIINRWLRRDQGSFKGNETPSYETCSFESVQDSIKVCVIISCKSWCSEYESFNLYLPFLTQYISKTSEPGLICITEL